MNHKRAFLLTLPLAVALLALPACRRTQDGRVVSDAQAQENAEAKVEEAKQDVQAAGAEVKQEAGEAAGKVEAGLERAGDQVEAGLATAGERLEAGAAAAGRAVDRGVDRAAERLGPAIDDATVTARVKARLIADPEVAAITIDVDTVNGVVTLNGRAATAAQRDEAVKLTRTTEGVLAVNDLIQVGSGQ